MDNENLEINEETTENVENEDIVVENSEDFAEENKAEEVVESDELSVEETAVEETEEKPEKKHWIKNKIVREVVSWIGTILLAIVIAIIINTYIFRISKVSGHSMNHTYHDKDTVYLTRLPYIFGDIERNEIVIFDSSFEDRNFLTDVAEALKYNAISYKLFNTEQPKDYYIKRVIAVAGDTIQFKEEGVYLNGNLLNEQYVNPEETPYYGNLSDDLKKGITIPDGYIFVMGDNRNHSADSRTIGLVPEDSVIGKVIGT